MLYQPDKSAEPESEGIKQIIIMKNLNETLEVTIYEAPKVEIIEVAVEKGFASSIDALSEEEWN